MRLLNELTAERRAKEIHHNIVLSVLGKCTQWERAEVLFRDMRELYGIQPSRVTYSTLISAYGRSGKTELAREVFRQMLARRIPPDDYTFVGLMLGPALDGNFRECARIATEMKEEYGVEHTVHTYNALIQAADIAGNYDKAVEVYDELLHGAASSPTTRRANSSSRSVNAGRIITIDNKKPPPSPRTPPVSSASWAWRSSLVMDGVIFLIHKSLVATASPTT